jgi:hypothetical protein
MRLSIQTSICRLSNSQAKEEMSNSSLLHRYAIFIASYHLQVLSQFPYYPGIRRQLGRVCTAMSGHIYHRLAMTKCVKGSLQLVCTWSGWNSLGSQVLGLS